MISAEFQGTLSPEQLLTHNSFLPHLMACGILAHRPEIELRPPAVEVQVLTSGPPRKTPHIYILLTASRELLCINDCVQFSQASDEIAASSFHRWIHLVLENMYLPVTIQVVNGRGLKSNSLPPGLMFWPTLFLLSKSDLQSWWYQRWL